MSSKYQSFKEKVISLEEDAEKFYSKGVSAAGIRLRKGLQEAKKLIKEVRNEIGESRKAAKVAKSEKKTDTTVEG